LYLFYPVKAQQPAKVIKIGFLRQTGTPSSFIDTFHHGMRELGYIEEGQNIVIEYRSGEVFQLPQLATELVQQKVEVIVALGPGVRAAKMATGTIPIAFS
jgi:hypothetical protein